MDNDRDASGRLNLAPLVRIPQDGDEDFRWAVKQVLDLVAFGVVLPHVDTGEEAVRLVARDALPTHARLKAARATSGARLPPPRGGNRALACLERSGIPQQGRRLATQF